MYGSKSSSSPEWTDKEILALLEGIDMYKEDWGRVRDHVNTSCHNGQHFRAQDDCILAFVRYALGLGCEHAAAPAFSVLRPHVPHVFF